MSMPTNVAETEEGIPGAEGTEIKKEKKPKPAAEGEGGGVDLQAAQDARQERELTLAETVVEREAQDDQRVRELLESLEVPVTAHTEAEAVPDDEPVKPADEKKLDDATAETFGERGDPKEQTEGKVGDFARKMTDTIFSPEFQQHLVDMLEGKVDPKRISEIHAALSSMEGLRASVEKAIDSGAKSVGTKEIVRNIGTVLEKVKDQLPAGYLDEVEKQLKDLSKDSSPESKSRLKTLASLGIDFIPVVGPAKVLIEASAGKTLDGTKLEGWRRGLHALEGATFLLLDLTGVGAVATKTAKGSLVSGKLLTRSAAIGRKLGVSREVYMPVFKAGKAVVRNPALAKAADKAFGAVLNYRRARLATQS
jgi:hypothetical protein